MSPVSTDGTQRGIPSPGEWVEAGMRGNCHVFVRSVQSGAQTEPPARWQTLWRYGRWVVYAFFIVAWFGLMDRTVRTSAFPDWARDALYGRSLDPRRALVAQWAYRAILYAPFIILSYYAHQWWLTHQRVLNLNVIPRCFLLPPPRPVRLRSFVLRRGGQFLARWAALTAMVYFVLLTGVALPLFWVHIDLVVFFEHHPLTFVLLSPAIASLIVVVIEQSQHWMEADEERTLALARNGIVVRATVMAMQEEKEWDGEEVNLYYRLYYVVNGTSPPEVIEVSMLKEQWQMLKVGDNVVLIYLPERPDHAQIAAEVARWVK
ncbi:MAG: hypothetical protein NZT92_06660 [Abditibacteriales bacterium]|nr:hypothetical protein [Abditibacteriales bacterium]MDW8365627.1 hypothetical protein [Abditibacteriales bacterium]